MKVSPTPTWAVHGSDTPAPPPGILLAGHFQEPPGYSTWREAGTRDWLLTYTLAGAGRYTHRGGTVLCRAGDVMLLVPGTPHDYATDSNAAIWDFYWAHFTPRPDWSGWLQLPKIGHGLLGLHVDDDGIRRRLNDAFDRVIVDSHALGLLRDDLALNGMEEVIILLAQQQAQRAAPQVEPRVAAVLQRLAASLNTPLSIEQLAAELALSPSRLAHLFKAQVGDSIGRVHMQLRLRHAARLLALTGRSVAEVAHDIGFPSPFHFSHQFKAYYGQSPQAYRRSVEREE